MFYACLDCMAKLEKIEKIINKPIKGGLARNKAIKDIRAILKGEKEDESSSDICK